MHCNRDAPGWERVYQRFRSDRSPVEFVGVGLRDTEAACRGFWQRYHLSFPNGYDVGERIARAYGFTYQPYWALIARDGTLVERGFGPSDPAVLESRVRDLLR